MIKIDLDRFRFWAIIRYICWVDAPHGSLTGLFLENLSNKTRYAGHDEKSIPNLRGDIQIDQDCCDCSVYINRQIFPHS